MERPLVIADCEVGGRRVDVRLGAGWVAAVGPDLAQRGDEVLDGRGAALLPGLHDHHLHLLALAAARSSTDLTAAADPAEADRLLAGAGAGGRVVGYDEHRHGPLDRTRLDRVAPGRALRVQHRSGLSWVLSTAALDRLGGARASDDGWVHRADGLGTAGDDGGPPDVAALGAELASLGVTGVTDATPVLDAEALRLLRDAALPQRLTLLGATEPGDVAGWAAVGPRKLLADEVRGLDVDGLAAAVREAHASGRAVAIHCVTRAECVAAVAALAAAGTVAGDRLEHATVLPDDADAFLAASGVTVVAMPAWLADRGDRYLDLVDADDRPFLHRLGGLRAAGVRVAAGSDAPFGPLDPWLAVRAAHDRRAPSGRAVGVEQSVDTRTALGWYLTEADDPGGRARAVAAGSRADLCLLSVPLADALAEPAAELVAATVIGGEVVHGP